MAQLQHDLIDLLRPLYVPLLHVVSGFPYFRVFLIIGAIAAFVTTLNVKGWGLWLAVLIGLYLLGAAWMLPQLQAGY